MTEELKPCPFCGRKINPTDDDTMYPTGTMWATDADGLRHYFSPELYRGMENLMPTPEGRCILIQCAENYGGCGAEITGDSKEDAFQKWNTRAPNV